MRILGFLVLGLSVSLAGCNPPAAEETAPVTPPAAGEATSGSTNAAIPSDTSVKLVKMKVSNMTCPHGCYPTVKETLEKQTGVTEVTLAEQKDKDTIDNPYVFVATTAGFDPVAAVNALKGVQFDGEVVAN